jgi:hypothetical protein
MNRVRSAQLQLEVAASLPHAVGAGTTTPKH